MCVWVGGRSVDASAAEQMPGVIACVFAEDIPGSNATGPIRHDETVLADRQVRAYFPWSGQSDELVSFLARVVTRAACAQVTCVGHIIGAVVADTQLHAQRAAKAVRIQYEELQPIITIQVSHLCAHPNCMCECGRKMVSWKPSSPVKVSKRFTAGLIDRRPLLPSPSISQSEPSKTETWRRDLTRLTTSSKVGLDLGVTSPRF